MIVWYNKKRYALAGADDSVTYIHTPGSLCHLISCDDTVPEYKTVACRRLEFSDPGPTYWDHRDNKLGLQTGVQ